MKWCTIHSAVRDIFNQPYVLSFPKQKDHIPIHRHDGRRKALCTFVFVTPLEHEQRLLLAEDTSPQRRSCRDEVTSDGELETRSNSANMIASRCIT
jgi:hypothetical protein